MIENPEINGRIQRSFIRVRSLIILDEPLIDGFSVPRDGMDPAWTTVKYERL